MRGDRPDCQDQKPSSVEGPGGEEETEGGDGTHREAPSSMLTKLRMDESLGSFPTTEA